MQGVAVHENDPSFLSISVIPSHAERVEHEGCYADRSDTALTIGNTLVERKWTIKEGLLTAALVSLCAEIREGEEIQRYASLAVKAVVPTAVKSLRRRWAWNQRAGKSTLCLGFPVGIGACFLAAEISP